MNQSLARTESGALSFTEEQQAMIRDMFANGASKEEFAALMEVAKARGLNPLLRQIHFVKRWDREKNKFVWASQASIDGIRAIADRTSQYDGQDEPENEYAPDGKLVCVKVRVYRKGIPRPFVGIARMSEYVQTTKDGSPTKFWRDMPHTMLAKCAEALAIRKAFPEDTGGLYVPEEMDQASNGQHEPRQLGAPPKVSPYGDEDEEREGDAEMFSLLFSQLSAVKEAIPGVETYDQVNALRGIIGTAKSQSELTKSIQEAKETLSGKQHAELSKCWQHCHRQLAKLEEKLKPDAAASFVDEPNPEDDGR